MTNRQSNGYLIMMIIMGMGFFFIMAAYVFLRFQYGK